MGRLYADRSYRSFVFFWHVMRDQATSKVELIIQRVLQKLSGVTSVETEEEIRKLLKHLTDTLKEEGIKQGKELARLKRKRGVSNGKVS